MVVIDEFAALAAELPGFMDALVNVAQRGRSLGMHLVLATQRPAGAVSANIRTNTALRIALRVLDPADSADVLDSPEASTIGRHRPGRAFARFGPGELVEFQCALVTGVTAAQQGVRVVPAPDGIPISESETASGDQIPDDLTRLAAAAITAWDGWGGSPPRQPWPDPLPTTVSLDSLTVEAGPIAVFALADDPNQQTQYPLEWDPDQGNVLLVGSPGSGTTTALGTLGISLTSRYSPADCHLYAIDSGSGQLAPLMALPHCGAVVGPDERDRIRRLIRRLEDELDQRLGQSRGVLGFQPSARVGFDRQLGRPGQEPGQRGRPRLAGLTGAGVGRGSGRRPVPRCRRRPTVQGKPRHPGRHPPDLRLPPGRPRALPPVGRGRRRSRNFAPRSGIRRPVGNRAPSCSARRRAGRRQSPPPAPSPAARHRWRACLRWSIPPAWTSPDWTVPRGTSRWG